MRPGGEPRLQAERGEREGEVIGHPEQLAEVDLRASTRPSPGGARAVAVYAMRTCSRGTDASPESSIAAARATEVSL